MEQLAPLTILFSSLALLAVMAIFRWKAYDEMYNLRKLKAYESALYHMNIDNKEDIKIALPDELLQQILDNAIERINKEISSLPENEPPLNRLIYEIPRDSLKKEKTNLKILKPLSSEIRIFFNRPFFVVILTIIAFLIFKGAEWINYLLYYAIFLCALRFYNLFNFSYEKNETHGFDINPFTRWIYDWWLKPGNISKIIQSLRNRFFKPKSNSQGS